MSNKILALFVGFVILLYDKAQLHYESWADRYAFSVFIVLLGVVLFQPQERQEFAGSALEVRLYNLGRLARRCYVATRNRVK